MQVKIWQNGLQGSYYESRTAEAVAGAVLLLYPPVRQSEGGGGLFNFPLHLHISLNTKRWGPKEGADWRADQLGGTIEQNIVLGPGALYPRLTPPFNI